MGCQAEANESYAGVKTRPRADFNVMHCVHPRAQLQIVFQQLRTVKLVRRNENKLTIFAIALILGSLILQGN